MRFVHLSDTRLGFSDLQMIDAESGVNLRERDFYLAWRRVVDRIIELKPDIVVHAGNLFHSPRPNNRAISEAMAGVKKLAEAKIPVVMIAGNRSTPRISSTANILRSLAVLEHVSVACKQKYERFQIGECAVHCLPHCVSRRAFEKSVSALTHEPAARFQILAAHGVWRQNDGEVTGRTGEFNEQSLEAASVMRNVDFDYIALGHFPGHTKISENIFFSGAAERTGFEEAEFPTGFVLVDLEKRGNEFIATPSRKMVRMGALDCAEQTPEQIYTALENEKSASIAEALVRIDLVNLPRKTLRALDMAKIDRIFSRALYVEKVFEPTAKNDILRRQANIDALAVEFDRYLDNAEEAIERRELFLETGHELLREAEARIENDS